MDLSIVIVNYNTKELTAKCLASVFRSITKLYYEVFVVDNGSRGDDVEFFRTNFPQAKIIANGSNLGFSKANNVALRQASGRLLLLLNSDTEVEPETLDRSILYMDAHSGVGIMGCRILMPDGTPDKAARRKFPNPANAFLRLFGLAHFSDYNITTPIDQEVEVDSVVGAFLMIRKSVTDKIGLLNEEYFMYGEDLDWCWRVKEVGYKVMYYPGAVIHHFKYGSARLIPIATIRMAHQAMKIFYRDHYANRYPWIFNQLVFLGINLRQYFVLFANLFRNVKKIH